MNASNTVNRTLARVRFNKVKRQNAFKSCEEVMIAEKTQALIAKLEQMDIPEFFASEPDDELDDKVWSELYE